MIIRHMLCGYCADSNIQISENNYNASMAIYKNNVFIYLETNSSEQAGAIVENIVKGNFIKFPDGNKFIEMIDIFHYSYPHSEKYWERKINNKKKIFKIAFLNSKRVGEYIFYHYKSQKEAYCDYDKYGAIYINNNVLIMYLEEPAERADLTLIENKWEKVIPDYDGDIINDCTIENQRGEKGWLDCKTII